VIVSVCLNAAIDVTYFVPTVTLRESNRIARVHRQAGGKGVNVARVLAALGVDVVVTGLSGSATGAEIVRDLTTAGICTAFTSVAAPSRHTVTVVDTDGSTVFNEPGPVISAAEWRAFVTAFDELVPAADVVVLSGSTPPGCPDTAYRDLAELAHAANARVIVDAGGDLLRHSLDARPAVVKPNSAELVATLGRPVRSMDDAVLGARMLLAKGAQAVVVTRGAAGFVAVRPEQAFTVHPSKQVPGNPTGAGDALAAALARALAAGLTWPECLTEAAAIASAAVASPVAGFVPADTLTQLRQSIIIEEIPVCPPSAQLT